MELLPTSARRASIRRHEQLPDGSDQWSQDRNDAERFDQFDYAVGCRDKEIGPRKGRGVGVKPKLVGPAPHGRDCTSSHVPSRLALGLTASVLAYSALAGPGIGRMSPWPSRGFFDPPSLIRDHVQGCLNPA